MISKKSFIILLGFMEERKMFELPSDVEGIEDFLDKYEDFSFLKDRDGIYLYYTKTISRQSEAYKKRILSGTPVLDV